MLCNWEGNHSLGLVSGCASQWSIHLHDQWPTEGDEHPAYDSEELALPLPLYMIVTSFLC